MKPRLLYVLQAYPMAGETFIQREIDALRARGWPLRIWSIRAGRIVDPDTAPSLPSPPAPLAATSLSPSSAGAPGVDLDASGAAPAARLHAAPCILPWLFRRLRYPRLLAAVLRRWRQWQPLTQAAAEADIVHAHFAGLPVDLAGLAARLSGRPLTCSVHAWDVFAQASARLRLRLDAVQAVAACSRAAANAVQRAGIPPDRIHLIRHGLPLDAYPFRPCPGQRHMLAIGRFVAKKGFDTLIDAYVSLRRMATSDQPPLPDLCLVGDGPLRAALERQAQASGENHTIHFAGWRDVEAVRGFLQDAVLLALPSRRLPRGDHDGIANVLLEAMAMGVPVVTTTAGAAAEVLRDGIDARLVAPDQPAALAQAMRDILDQPEAARDRASKARQIVERHFNIETAIHPLEKLFRDSLAGKAAFLNLEQRR